MADVFVSYSRGDKARVAPLVAAIEDQGWSVWWDPDIVPGQEFDRRIVAELACAHAVVVVWTRNSVESRWVRGEARVAAERGILVPVRLDGATLPIDVRAFHTTDLDAPGAGGDRQIQEVIRALGDAIARRRTGGTAATDAGPAPSAAATGASRVAIRVLPFANMSHDPEQEYFSDGITEDIITDLSKVSALSVISRNSSFVYKGRNVEVPKVARELKVRHVLEGSAAAVVGSVLVLTMAHEGDEPVPNDLPELMQAATARAARSSGST